MKKLLMFLAFSVATIAVSAQKTYSDANAEKRTVGSFHGIEVGTGIQLALSNGNTEEVAVSAVNTEFRDKIVTKIENGILKIYYEDKMNSMNTKRVKKELKAYVSYKTLDRLEATTGASVDIDGTLKSTSLKIKANTGATINGKVNSTDLEVYQSTGSLITISGSTEKLDVEGDTGSRFKGVELSANICNASVSTGANISVAANKELSAKANTGGNVSYKGTPSLKDIKKNTGGSVRQI